MRKLSPRLNQEKLLAEAKERMYAYMPPEDHHDGAYNPADKTLNYFYFSGIWHIENGLVTSRIIRNLQDGASMLSVGTGDGHLERLLIQGFSVPKENIHVADKALDKKVKEYGFRDYEFDMIGEWPDLNKDYDYIVFPESLGVALLKNKKSFFAPELTTRFCEDVRNTVGKVTSGQDVSTSDADFYISLIQRDVPGAEFTCTVLTQALRYLSDSGNIRISRGGGIANNQQYAYTVLRLKDNLIPTSTYGQGPSVFKKRIVGY